MRTRFAPSPTGYLHIGGARTALFAWLYARKNKGEFILRIEDTDQERSAKQYVDAIIDGMDWLGLDYDRDPVYQMERMSRYQQVIQQLLKENKAYRCYCTKERLDNLRQSQLANKEKPRYDGHCRSLNLQDENHPYVIRFKNPTQGTVSFDDLVRGTISVENAELDDVIIQRTDGTPTYNFCVVIDDWDMEITTVIRGDDHINNTPRQINIFSALNVKPPQYAHVPMILGADGKRLSKRHGAMSVTEYRDQGYLPQALINYLVRLGWSHGDQEIFSKAELIELFDLQQINRAPAAFNQEKLLWLNQHYMKTENAEYIADLLEKFLMLDISNGPKLVDVVKVLRERSSTLVEMADKAKCFYQSVIKYDVKAATKFLIPEIVPALEFIKAELEQLIDWQEAKIHAIVQATLDKFALKMPKLAQPLRIALTGNTQSPSIDATLYLMGQQRCVRDIETVLKYIADNDLSCPVAKG